MALSPNYSWSEPDNSSLVKNGAADIRTLGDAIDTSVWNVGYGQAGKNRLINGNFDIWQRGTSFSSPLGTAYTADRWDNNGDAGGTTTISRQTTGVPAGSQYCIRTAYGAASSYANRSQIIETSNTLAFMGRTVTFQVKLRKNASFASGLNVRISKSATVDASAGATWTILATTLVANASLPTGTTSADWYTATVTAAIPNDGTANSVKCSVAVVSAGASGEYWEMAQAQLEVGSVATPFSRAAGSTVGGELALCQRYYQVISGYQAGGNAYSTTAAGFIRHFPVTMRTAPTATYPASLTSSIQVFGTGNVTPTAVATANSTTQAITFYGTGTGAMVTSSLTFWSGLDIALSSEL